MNFLSIAFFALLAQDRMPPNLRINSRVNRRERSMPSPRARAEAYGGRSFQRCGAPSSWTGCRGSANT
jgi:hypothetical protein